MTRSRLLSALLIILLLAVPTARACSIYYEPGETPETTYSAVATAPIVVEARAVRSLEATDRKLNKVGAAEFAVTRSLRGDAKGHIRVRGAFFSGTWDYRDWNWLGTCFRDFYQAGVPYLLLLSPDGEGGYVPTTAPRQFTQRKQRALGRAWVEVAADIVRIEDTLLPDQRMAAIRALLAPLRHPGASAAEKLKADSLSEQLDTVQATWPASHLIWLHGELSAGRIPAGLRLTPWVENWSLRVNGGPPILPEAPKVKEFRRAVLWALSQPGHPEAASFFDGLAARDDDPMGLLRALIHMAWHERRADAARLLSARLLTLPIDEENRQLHMFATAMSGDAKDGEEPAWRRDPALRDTWPDLAWRINAYLRDDDSPDMFDGIVPYMSVPDPAAAIDKAVWVAARDGEHPVVGWAEQQLRDPANRAKWDQYYHGWQTDAQGPLRILAASGGGEAVLEELFCLGGEARMAVIAAFRREGDTLDRGFYPRMLASPGLSGEERDGLLLAAASAAARRSFVQLDYLAIVKGNPPKAEPLACP